MNYVLALVLMLLTTAPVLDAARRRGVLTRPEFYLLFVVYIYGTFGYATHLLFSATDFRFILPARELSIHTSYIYASCAVFAIYVGGRFYRAVEPENQTSYTRNRTLAVLAAAGCVLALIFNTYYFYTFGLFSGGFDRVEFINEFGTSAGFKFPYMALLLASLPVLALNERWPVSWGVVLAFALLHLPVGDRRVVLAALIVTLVAKLLAGSRFGRKTLLAVLAAVLVAGVAVGYSREEGLSAFSSLDYRGIFLALSEFSRPFVTLVYYVDHGYTLLFGAGLAQAFVNIVPGVLLPFDKFVSPGLQFVGIVETLDVFPARPPGFGFYPVTEALLNFGPVGVPIFFLLFTLLVRKLSALALARGFAFVVPVLCAAMFSFGRSSFSDVLVTNVWVVAGGLALFLSARLVEKTFGRIWSTGKRAGAGPKKRGR